MSEKFMDNGRGINSEPPPPPPTEADHLANFFEKHQLRPVAYTGSEKAYLGSKSYLGKLDSGADAVFVVRGSTWTSMMLYSTEPEVINRAIEQSWFSLKISDDYKSGAHATRMAEIMKAVTDGKG